MNTLFCRCLLLGLLLLSGQAAAQSSSPAPALPEWDKLTAEQRDTLISQVRERWNTEPRERSRMLYHAKRWQAMTPEEREQARKGMQRFEDMSPRQREEAKLLFERMSNLPRDEAKKLRDRWNRMSPQERRDWLDQHPARDLPRSR